ncbi:hypothetical protein ZWY2020_027545 [Hordeum vulgare]|nr:hypothetical protein ZWY2020_027545 [Hordeum vulgare]
MSINTENLRHKDRGNLRNILFTKLHERYKFPGDVESTCLSRNKVNSAALTKMSKALSTWRSVVKRMIDKGDSYEKIKATNPSISEDDYKEFKIKCESKATAESSQWGKEMRELNLGVNQLGPGGYRVAEPIWDKEDAERAKQGLPPRFEKYGDKQNYVGPVQGGPVTKELTTDAKTRRVLDTESSSAGSYQSSHWDTNLNRAFNIMKNKDKSSKPSSAGRVAGKGLSTKWSSYYNAGGRKERNANLGSQSREVEELKAKVAWIAGGQQGPPPIPSFTASSSQNAHATPLVSPAPAGTSAASGPSVTCMPAVGGASTLAERDAITGAGADVPCTLLHFMGGELIDVAKGRIVQPGNPMFHGKPMPPTTYRIQLVRVLPGCDDLLPPFHRRADKDDVMTLALLALALAKSQIRLGRGHHPQHNTARSSLAPIWQDRRNATGHAYGTDPTCIWHVFRTTMNTMRRLSENNVAYPVFVAKVPEGKGFVDSNIGGMIVSRFADIFVMFNLHPLHHTFVRLFLPTMEMRIIRDKTPDLVIVDPLYMRAKILGSAGDRQVASSYLEGVILANSEKDNFLVPYFPCDTRCTLILLSLKYSTATYFDSDRQSKKDYTSIKKVLGEALLGYAISGGTFSRTSLRHGKHVFTLSDVTCIKQPPAVEGCLLRLHHMRAIIGDVITFATK